MRTLALLILILLTNASLVLPLNASALPANEIVIIPQSTPEPGPIDAKTEIRSEQLGGCPAEIIDERPWLDRTHAYLNNRLCAPAIWFDDFFGDERALEDPGASTFIRLRTYATSSERDGWDTKANVRASIKLPRLSERVRLLLTGDRDDDSDIQGVPAELDNRRDNTNLGLRFLLHDGAQGKLDLDGTVRISGGNLNPRAVLRYERVFPVGNARLLRGTQRFYWERLDGAGAETRIDWEWQPGTNRVWRWSTSGWVLENTSGVPWHSALTRFERINDRIALSMEAGLRGQTQPIVRTEEYFAGLRFRRQFARPWLFYEIEPRYSYLTSTLDRAAVSDWRLTLTLEVQFRNDGRY